MTGSDETKRPKTLSLKRTEASTVKQSFSHGRTTAVVVEKKRSYSPPAGPKPTDTVLVPPTSVQKPPSPPASKVPPPRTGVILRQTAVETHERRDAEPSKVGTLDAESRLEDTCKRRVFDVEDKKTTALTKALQSYLQNKPDLAYRVARAVELSDSHPDEALGAARLCIELLLNELAIQFGLPARIPSESLVQLINRVGQASMPDRQVALLHLVRKMANPVVHGKKAMAKQAQEALGIVECLLLWLAMSHTEG